MNLLSLRDVAAKLGVSVGTVRRLVATRALPSLKVGTGKTSPHRVRPSDLAAFVRARRAASLAS